MLILGLTNSSIGADVNKKFEVNRENSGKIIALAGNPNVGKSTVFNALTGLKQHTGNWTGKTVSNAKGEYKYKDEVFTIVDVPGTYSLMASSNEEAVARDFICFGSPDAVVVVLDATCLERNLNLALQILELVPNVSICVNLIDEAEKKGIEIDFDELSLHLGAEVTQVCGRNKEGLEELKENILVTANKNIPYIRPKITYNNEIEHCIDILIPEVEKTISTSDKKLNSRWLALKLLEYEDSLKTSINDYLGLDLWETPEVKNKLSECNQYLNEREFTTANIHDSIVEALVDRAENIANKCVNHTKEKYDARDRRLDKILTSKATGIPIMLLMLAVIFWITIVGANYPSQWLSSAFGKLENVLSKLLLSTPLPHWVEGVFVQGMFKTLGWVISVMLPPMAIFFPLFTILEDSGYLPRVAFNMDKFFRKAGAHGKQSLTMCLVIGQTKNLLVFRSKFH